jgi:DNA-binding response OmpR family regulator
MSLLLVVNDCPNAVYLLSDLLKYKGFEVVTAENGESGWQQYQKYRPEVIISDSAMPVLDGYQLLQRVRKSAPQQRFIMLSPQMSLPKYHALATKLGADFCMNMPLEIDELVEKIYTLYQANR